MIILNLVALARVLSFDVHFFTIVQFKFSIAIDLEVELSPRQGSLPTSAN